MSKTVDFAEHFTFEDPISGEFLEWTWDSEELHFIATDRSGKIYRLVPLTAELEIEEADDDLEDDEVSED